MFHLANGISYQLLSKLVLYEYGRYGCVRKTNNSLTLVVYWFLELGIDNPPSRVVVIHLGVSNFGLRVVGHILDFFRCFPLPTKHRRHIYRSLGLSRCLLAVHGPYTSFCPFVNYQIRPLDFLLNCWSLILICRRFPFTVGHQIHPLNDFFDHGSTSSDWAFPWSFCLPYLTDNNC